jgi:hypothetical protein
MAEGKEGTKGGAAPAARRSAKSEDVQNAFEEAHLEFVRAIQRGPEGANQRFEEAQRNYTQAIQDLYSSEEGQKQLASGGVGVGMTAYMDFLREVQEAYVENHKQLQEAYRNYLRAIQKAWTRIDVESADPALIAGIGQSLIMVASMGGSSVGNG